MEGVSEPQMQNGTAARWNCMVQRCGHVLDPEKIWKVLSACGMVHAPVVRWVSRGSGMWIHLTGVEETEADTHDA